MKLVEKFYFWLYVNICKRNEELFEFTCFLIGFILGTLVGTGIMILVS